METTKSDTPESQERETPLAQAQAVNLKLIRELELVHKLVPQQQQKL